MNYESDIAIMEWDAQYRQYVTVYSLEYSRCTSLFIAGPDLHDPKKMFAKYTYKTMLYIRPSLEYGHFTSIRLTR
jgi:hypothetical protein